MFTSYVLSTRQNLHVTLKLLIKNPTVVQSTNLERQQLCGFWSQFHECALKLLNQQKKSFKSTLKISSSEIFMYLNCFWAKIPRKEKTVMTNNPL